MECVHVLLLLVRAKVAEGLPPPREPALSSVVMHVGQIGWACTWKLNSNANIKILLTCFFSSKQKLDFCLFVLFCFFSKLNLMNLSILYTNICTQTQLYCSTWKKIAEKSHLTGKDNDMNLLIQLFQMCEIHCVK